jgi:hypothetical protein
MAVPTEILELIQKSGNTFHAKVARWFIDRGWNVEVSPYYMDQTQGKAREIDLIVEKICGEVSSFSTGIKEKIAIRLYIECKFVAQGAVFWFANKDDISARRMVTDKGDFPENNSFTSEHHYLAKSPVAKLFGTANNNKSTENEPFYKALNQAINGMVSMRGRRPSIPGLDKSRIPTHILEFPVVVCSSFTSMYGVDFYEDSAPTQIADNFQLEVRYAYIDSAKNSRNDYFLLDFVEFDKLEKFIKLIEHDANIYKQINDD